MTALEFRLIAYGLLFLIIVGGSGFLGYHIAARHYQAVMAADRAASEQAVLAQQERTIAAQNAANAASVAAEKQYEDLKASSALVGDELSRSLRAYAYLRRSLMSSKSNTPSGSNATARGPEGDQSLAGLAGQAAKASKQTPQN